MIKLGLTNISRSKPPVLTYDSQRGLWCVWSAYNLKMTEGTYIELQQDGTMVRVTILPDGSTENATIK